MIRRFPLLFEASEHRALKVAAAESGISVSNPPLKRVGCSQALTDQSQPETAPLGRSRHLRVRGQLVALSCVIKSPQGSGRCDARNKPFQQ